MTTDLQLLERWRAGDQAAGSALFERHFASLRRFFATKSELADVEDLIQRTLVSCLESVAKFRAEAKFRTYLFTIARRELYRYIETKTRDRARVAVDHTVSSICDLGITPSRAAVASEEHALIVQAMQSLPTDFQITLELYYWEQLRGPELAEVLGITANTVRTRLHRAREAMRESLSRLRDGEVSEAELEASVSEAGGGLR